MNQEMTKTMMIKQAMSLTKEQRLAKIAQAEEYITNYIAWSLEKYTQDVLANKTDKRMHLYFGMSQNEELKTARANFKKDLRWEVEPLDSVLRKTMEYKLAAAMSEPEKYDNPQYVICFSKWHFMVIAIQKSVVRDKPARGQQIEFSSNEAPRFHQRCRANLKSCAK